MPPANLRVAGEYGCSAYVLGACRLKKMERRKEAKAEKAANIETAIEAELMERLKCGTYGDIYNFPLAQYHKALDGSEAVPDEQAIAAEDGAEAEEESEEESEDEVRLCSLHLYPALCFSVRHSTRLAVFREHLGCMPRPMLPGLGDGRAQRYAGADGVR